MGDSSSDEAEFTGDLEEEEQQEAEASSDEEVPLATLKKKDDDRKRSASQNISYAEDDGDDSSSSSEDDIPLASLAKKKPAPPPKKKNGATKKAATAKKKEKPSSPKKKKKVIKKKTSNVSAKSAASEKTYEWASMALYGTECTKGMLIQRLLCRWWYAFEWPDPSKLPDKPPSNYDSLDGFKGVYVCTLGENVGHVLDMRDNSKCPSFQNFAKKPAAELQDLLLKALQEQKRHLIAAEGTGTSTEKELDVLIKWTNKLNPDKADREAIKVLKASCLELP